MGTCYACFLNNLLIAEDGKSDQVKAAESASMYQRHWLWSGCVMKLDNVKGLFQLQGFCDFKPSSLKCAVFFSAKTAGAVRGARVSRDNRANSSPVLPVETGYVLPMK